MLADQTPDYVSSLLGLAELLAQLVLRPHQGPLAGRGQVLAGAVDVEGQHRKRGTVRITLAPTTPFGRALQRCGDPFRVAQREDALLQGERVALLGDPTRPAPSAARLRCPPGCGVLAASFCVSAAPALGCRSRHDITSESGLLTASTRCRAGRSRRPLHRSGPALIVIRFGNRRMNARTSAAAVAIEPMLLREDLGTVAVITLNRPRARNALSEAMLAALSEELARLAAERRIRAVVLAANGPAFSAGHDLKELIAHRTDADGGRGYIREIMDRCSAVMLSILRLPQPVIAAVEATATAAGCQLVATCDLAVASTNAKFCTPGVHIGLFCSTPMVALSRNLTRKHALEMLLTGDMISAEDAYRVGLVNRVVEAGTAREEALNLARRIAANSAAAVKFGKEAFYQQLEMGIADAYAHATEVMVKNMMARDAEEGIAAFVEKRQPTWEGD